MRKSVLPLAIFGFVLITLGLGALIGCGDPGIDAQLADYREALESALAIQAREADQVREASFQLPRRRERSLAVEDVRMGPFDFLATIGCSLSEVVAERNGALGKVLEPTRRLEHELRVIAAMEACLPTLAPKRAERLAVSLGKKRSELYRHRWNAVWLDQDLERFLSFGPASWLGGVDPGDGSIQLRRAAIAFTANNVGDLEAAFSQLRDDPALGITLARLNRVMTEIDRIASLIAPHSTERCGATERRLARIFQVRFLPIQVPLGDLNRAGDDVAEAFAALFDASAAGVDVPPSMRQFRNIVSGESDRPDLWERFRGAMRAHAAAWAPLLEACGVIPSVGAA